MIEKKDAPLSIPHEQALYLICKELKKYTTVVISGEGADELFWGYDRIFRWAKTANSMDINEFDKKKGTDR